MNQGADPTAEIPDLHAATGLWGDPTNGDEMLRLLRALYAVGRRDLPLGRLFEGHVDALQIVTRYGTARQGAAVKEAARGGAVLGVWNADLPGEALRLEEGRLNGGKSYASGAGLLSHALVTAEALDGRRLVLLDLAQTPPQIDRTWWRTLGMQRSQTHQVRWRDAVVPAAAVIGLPGDYGREPHFSGGALRFVAVQAGGVAALFDHVRDHLRIAGRASDLNQANRLAELFTLAQGAADATARAAIAGLDAGEDAGRLAHVSAARIAVAEAADRAIALAQQAVGLQGLFLAHPLAAAIADLTVYLRQPAPDAQRLRVGQAAAAGLIEPRL